MNAIVPPLVSPYLPNRAYSRPGGAYKDPRERRSTFSGDTAYSCSPTASTACSWRLLSVDRLLTRDRPGDARSLNPPRGFVDLLRLVRGAVALAENGLEMPHVLAERLLRSGRRELHIRIGLMVVVLLDGGVDRLGQLAKFTASPPAERLPPDLRDAVLLGGRVGLGQLSLLLVGK